MMDSGREAPFHETNIAPRFPWGAARQGEGALGTPAALNAPVPLRTVGFQPGPISQKRSRKAVCWPR